jgi:two-component system cell cycle response regulator
MKKILIIDQHPFSRIILKDLLNEQYQVFEAASCDEAIMLSGRHQIDLILLDMERTDNNGPPICLRLKEDNSTKYIPLVLLSSCDQKEDILNGLHAGAEDYITKPICENDLLARLDTHLRTKNYYSDLEKEDLMMLLELAEIISVTRNPKKILAIIVEKMAEAIDVSRCSIIGLNDDGELLVMASSDLSRDQEVTIDLDNYPEIEKALTTQSPVILQDIKEDPLMEPVREKIRGLTDNSIFVAPIIKKQHVIGTFFLRTTTPVKSGISTRISKLCQLVANISGNALENAVLFEAMQSQKRLLEELAFRDSLTGLYNHQQFHTHFEKEFSRAQRHNLPLSCVFADIDDFKRINDRFGHVIGDVVLKQIGKLIAQMLRKSDIAARYGGEEFAILLPNTTSIGANDFANRLLQLVRELSIQHLKGEYITVSVGVSTCQNETVTSYVELLQLADKAMYAAKLLEKNRVCQAPGLPGSPLFCSSRDLSRQPHLQSRQLSDRV